MERDRLNQKSDHVDNLLGCLSSPGSPSVWGGIHARRIIISLFRSNLKVQNNKLTFIKCLYPEGEKANVCEYIHIYG
jgi:hypothetical protein